MIFDKIDSNDKKALLLRNNNIIKLSYELHTDIKKALEENNLNIFSPEENDFINYLNNNWKSQGENIINNLKQVDLSQTEKNRVNSLSKQRNLKSGEYLEFLGFKNIDKRFVSEQEIIDKIKKYADKNNCIHLKVTDEDYQFFLSRASRNNKQSIYDFFKNYGFYYKRGHNVEYIFEKHMKIISKRYIVTGRKIYISSYDPYYRTIVGIANNRKKNLDDLLKDMGFEIITHKRDLPDTYIAYDYSKELSKSLALDSDNIYKILSLLSNENNEIYLDVTTYAYYIIFLKSKLDNISITEVLANYGYKRIYNSILQDNTTMEENNDILNTYEDIYRHKLLNELNELESSFSLKSNEGTRLERNKKLVSKLKDLYLCKCQLCNPDDPLPLICLENGEIYSEVHHITSLHLAKSQEDINYIDSYKNTIVLCPYHHKYVHLHDGGFNIFVKDEDDVLYLQNKKGKKFKYIPIIIFKNIYANI